MTDNRWELKNHLDARDRAGYVSPVFLVEPGVARAKWPIIAYTRPDVGAAMCDAVLHTQTDALFGPVGRDE